MNKSVLVLGISGQDGAYIGHSLLKKGYKVIGITRKNDDANLKNLRALGILDRVNLIQSSYLDIEKIENICRK